MTDTTNADALINAAQQVSDAAAQLAPGAVSPEDQATKLAATFQALGTANGTSALIDTLNSLSGVDPLGFTADLSSAGQPVIKCPDGSEFIPPTPDIGSLNKIGDTKTDFFPKGPGSEIFKFIFNIMADIAAGFSIFGSIGTIQARELINGFQAVRPTVPISPADAADMVERNKLPKNVAQQEAAMSGVGPERFEAMIKAAGEPIGIMQQLELLRRDFWDKDKLYEGVAESRVYTKYFCDLLNLVYETMSAADAVEGFIKGVVIKPVHFTENNLTPPNIAAPHRPTNPTPAEQTAYENAVEAYDTKLSYEFFASMFRRAGGMPQQWDILHQAAGDAIGVERAAALEAHGKISLPMLKQVIKRSRINPIFESLGLLGNDKWFSAFQIGSILTSHPELAPQALQWLIEDGYPEDQAKAYVTAKSGVKAGKLKAETEAQILSTYQAGFIGQDQALKELTALGYPAAVAKAAMATHDARRVVAMQDAVIGRIRNAFLNGRHDIHWARTELVKLGVAAEAIKHYLAIWTVEEETQDKTVTASQVGRLFHMGRIGTAEAKKEWAAMGYSPHDVHYLEQEYLPTARSLTSAKPAANIKP